MRSLYISHDADGTPAAALLVDYLEEAIEELGGHVACSSLPGYTAATGGPSLTPADAALVIGIANRRPGAVVAHEMLTARELDTACILLSMCEVERDNVPGVCHLRATPGDLVTLAEDAAYLLDRPLRLTVAARAQIGEFMEHATEISAEPSVEAMYEDFEEPAAARPVSVPPRPSSVPPRPSMVVPSRRWPSYLQAAEAGFHMGASLYEGRNPFQRETHAGNRTSFDECLDALDANRAMLEGLHDDELWQCAFENLLDKLPVAASKVGHWYEVGFQTILLCKLSSERAGGGGERAERDLAQDRRRAWDALCHSAFLVGISSEELGEIGGMFHDLTGPSPDLDNVQRALDRVRSRARRLQQRDVSLDSQPAIAVALD